MLNKYQRSAVERIKSAKDLRIVLGVDEADEGFLFLSRMRDISKRRHDIAMAVQDYFNKANKS